MECIRRLANPKLLVSVIAIIALCIAVYIGIGRIERNSSLMRRSPSAVQTEYSPFGILNIDFLVPPSAPVLAGMNFAGSPTLAELNTFEDVTTVGAKWVRLSSTTGMTWAFIESTASGGKGHYNWSAMDYVVTELQSRGVKIVTTIAVANELYTASSQDVVANFSMSDEALAGYKNFIAAAAARYNKGSIYGTVNVWQLENELDVLWKNTVQTEGINNYINLLKITSDTIRSINPEASIALAGIAAPSGFDTVYVPLLDAIRQYNYSKPLFDIFDFHWNSREKGNYAAFTLPDTAALAAATATALKDYLNKRVRPKLSEIGYTQAEIWSTEMSSHDGFDDSQGRRRAPTDAPFVHPHTETDHASELIKCYMYALAQGVKAIFWVRLTEWENFGPKNAYFNLTGLIKNANNSGNNSFKKLAYYAFKKMTEVLDWTNIADLKVLIDTDTVHVYQFTKTNGQIVWIAWTDILDGWSSYKLTAVPGDKVTIVESVPFSASGTGADISFSDANSAFKTLIIPADKNQSAYITFGSIPVWAFSP